MPSTRLVAVTVMLVALSAGAMAGTITDPAMSMDAGSFSTALSLFTSFTPTNGGGVLDLFNDYPNELITSFEFQTTLAQGLTPSPTEAAFSCNNATNLTLNNPFFLNCSVNYNPNSGQLSILFSGVNPLTGSFVNHGIGTDQGIPPLLPGCTDANADTAPCAVQAHFAISFNDNFVFTGPPAGGWSTSANPGLFSTQPTFGPPIVTLEQLPEPSSVFLVLAGLLAFAARSRRSV